MKNHNDVMTDVFRRRDEYENVQKEKRKTMKKAVFSLSCICLMALAVFGISKTTTACKLPMEPTSTESQAVSSNVSEQTAEKNIIKINSTDQGFVGAGKHNNNIYLAVKDKVYLSPDEAVKYYNTNIYPQVPADLSAWDNAVTIYKRDAGKGEVYNDDFILNYSTDDFKRSVNIEGGKVSIIGPSCEAIWSYSEEFEESEINGEKVIIAFDEETGYYHVAFTHKGVEFRIITEGLNENELVDIISSLIS